MEVSRVIAVAAGCALLSSAALADTTISGATHVTPNGTEYVPLGNGSTPASALSQAVANLWIHGAPVRWTVSMISGTSFTNGTITITGAADCNGHLLTMPFSKGPGAGSGTLDIKIGTTDVTGLAAVNLGTATSPGTATASNSFSVNGTLTATLTGVSGTLDGFFTPSGTCD